MLLGDVVRINEAPASSAGPLSYVPFYTLCFVVGSYLIEKIILYRGKKKQIVREWYKENFLQPGVLAINKLFEDIRDLTYKNLALFEIKQQKLPKQEFLRYKVFINTEFQKLKVKFYNEQLLPINVNYPDIAGDSSSFLLTVQDLYIDLFGGDTITKADFETFVNNLFIEKGKLIATLRQPLHYSLSVSVLRALWSPIRYVINFFKN